jgi:hypothetical protein
MRFVLTIGSPLCAAIWPVLNQKNNPQKTIPDDPSIPPESFGACSLRIANLLAAHRQFNVTAVNSQRVNTMSPRFLYSGYFERANSASLVGYGLSTPLIAIAFYGQFCVCDSFVRFHFCQVSFQPASLSTKRTC